MVLFKRWLRRGVLLSLLAVLLGGGPATSAAAKTVTKVQARAAYVMDAQSGQVLYQQNADKRYPIASLSKLLTVYLTVKAINDGKINWNDQVPISQDLLKLSHSYAYSSLRMKKGETFTVKQLVAAAMIASSNSAATALGEYVAGSNAKFIQLMNQQSEDWGIEANFISSSGLDNTDLKDYNLVLPDTGKKAENLVSAKAITTVAQHLIQADPGIVQISSQKEASINGTEIYNENTCLKGQSHYDKATNIDGLKTGYTENAKLCFTATYTVNGQRMIATILGGDTTFSAMNKLIKQLKKSYQLETTALTDRRISLANGLATTVTAEPTNSQAGVWYQNKTAGLTTKVETKLTPAQMSSGTVNAGDPVAQATVIDTQTGSKQEVTYHSQQSATLFADRVVFTSQSQVDQLLQALVKPLDSAFE
ncbi:D-alanyl-D-alanine carboxypeptidase family protein [Levilactobacillus cerevisiae]|uniref:D-alanyl-D-alanine carboxypeptidase family protein n=1 Tax=Levilactobacillus cerevisiae TaxID=1704076 RepID=UPI000F79D2ED|nr:D-alanyl-D-alanine carboxypeptidase family protein [Levilactobacillus cerevisiae]